MSFTLRQLRYFIAVAETGKISDAAINVNISPSSVTEAVKDLEDMLGVKLLERKKSGVSLTIEGYRFLKSAKKVMSAVAEAKQSMRSAAQDIEGTLRLATSVTVSGYFLAGIFDRFRRAFPNIHVQIEEHSRVVIERRISEGTTDVGILLVSNVKDSEGIETLSLLQSRRNLWVGANHEFANKDAVSLKEVSEESYIQLMIDEAAATTSSYWKTYNLKPNITFKTESVEAVRSLVANGAGVTILSDMVYRPWSLEGDRIETVPVIEKVPTMDTGLLWSTKRSLTPQARAFVDFCRMQYSTGGRS